MTSIRPGDSGVYPVIAVKSSKGSEAKKQASGLTIKPEQSLMSISAQEKFQEPERKILSIGRNSETVQNDIGLFTPSISRNHLELSKLPNDEIGIRDLRSCHGSIATIYPKAGESIIFNDVNPNKEIYGIKFTVVVNGEAKELNLSEEITEKFKEIADRQTGKNIPIYLDPKTGELTINETGNNDQNVIARITLLALNEYNHGMQVQQESTLETAVNIKLGKTHEHYHLHLPKYPTLLKTNAKDFDLTLRAYSESDNVNLEFRLNEEAKRTMFQKIQGGTQAALELFGLKRKQ